MTKRREKLQSRLSKIENVAIRITKAVGSIESILIHTLFFLSCFIAILFGFGADKVMLTLTTVVSLEAIYLSIFIQMSVNKNTADIEEIAEDIDEIAEDVEEIQEDIEDIEEHVEDIEEDIDEIQKDVEGIEKDIDVIQEDIEDIEEEVEEDDIDKAEKKAEKESFERIENILLKLTAEIESIKQGKK
jgi:septal ring factor EnvC (AmiA/AmiB activator)